MKIGFKSRAFLLPHKIYDARSNGKIFFLILTISNVVLTHDVVAFVVVLIVALAVY